MKEGKVTRVMNLNSTFTARIRLVVKETVRNEVTVIPMESPLPKIKVSICL